MIFGFARFATPVILLDRARQQRCFGGGVIIDINTVEVRSLLSGLSSLCQPGDFTPNVMLIVDEGRLGQTWRLRPGAPSLTL